METRRPIRNPLAEEDALFRAFGDSISQMAWAAWEDGYIYWYNRRWYDYTSTTPEEMEGWGWQKVHDPAVLPGVMEKWTAAIKSGQAFEMEFPLRGADGVYRMFLTRAMPLLGDDGKVVHWFGTNTDVGDLMEREALLRQARDAAEAASRSKDDFLAALSHELRTPLTPVLMTAAALAEDPQLPAEIREQLHMMRHNIQIQARLVDDLLDVTRISRGKLMIAPVVSDLHLLLKHTAQMVQSEDLGKQHRIFLSLEASQPYALVDPTRIQQVFWNLLRNALKFTPAGGTVTIRTANDSEGWITLEVEDNGIGIDSETLPLVFEAFEQGAIGGQHRYGGLGLGLTISQAIVHLHGGTIKARSEGLGKGATFSVALATALAPESAPRDDPPREVAENHLRLLVVEDHDATRTVLARLLSRGGNHIQTVATAAEALAAYSSGNFDCVISDLGLPDQSGLELMRNIQSIRPVKAIALSGYGMEEDIRQTREAGFTEHIVKPVDFDQLQQMITRLTDI